ncbi:MAG: PilZ domain-containing protein [Sandaracinaceae bacterium]|nr:PilZ domain-containing protein [Sandaracinaceae bacterium]
MSRDRRNSERIPMWFPIAVSTPSVPEGLGISHDASPRGILFASGVQLEIGATVTIKFRLNKTSPEQVATGKVVRVEVNDDDPTGMWPNRLALVFETPLLGVESIPPKL